MERISTTYFGRIYQARYLSGIVAGNEYRDGQNRLCGADGFRKFGGTGGIDAFALGIYSVNQDAEVYVKVTNSWFDPDMRRR